MIVLLLLQMSGQSELILNRYAHTEMHSAFVKCIFFIELMQMKKNVWIYCICDTVLRKCEKYMQKNVHVITS